MLFLSSGFTVSEASRDLAQDVKAALRAANIDLTAMAIDIGGISLLPRLSTQLSGDEPFTLLWRVLAAMGPSAWETFLALRGRRIGREVVGQDIGKLIAAVDAMVSQPLASARASLRAERKGAA